MKLYGYHKKVCQKFSVLVYQQYQNIITPNHHEAIISKEKFDKVQELNLSNITRLELENKVKGIYIDKNKNVKIDIK